MVKRAYVVTTTADVIERYLENHVHVHKDELVLAVDNHFGEGWFRHNYINRAIDDMVNEGNILLQEGLYYARLNTLQHEKLLSLACDNATPKQVRKMAFEEVIKRMSRTD